ncbi:MAG TPA: circularly permuted type 2 ATP-grasp protein [Gammaproteobacteria bacterium]|nr:circularly permuted type 2 ATP-grasp protein [Gammaproteobacteria bacterium]
MPLDWTQYQPGEFFDELFAAPGVARPAAEPLTSYLASLGKRELAERQGDAERAIAEMGITFTVYTEGQNIDRAWPFDVIPRTIEASEWARIERGLIQRLTALNRFIDDLYHDRRIIADGVVPEDIVSTSANFLPACVGADPPYGVWANICGSDLVRDADGTVYVLEDNLRVPSGVSYMLENRMITKQVFPEVFEHASILPVDDYASQLFDMLASLSPRKLDFPRVVVLTPGIYNSAYFEHSYLAQRMGVDLVEGSDLVVGEDCCVYVRTIRGLERVDVIYRRVNDTFLDPECFEKESVLGVPGLMRAWRAQTVALANAPGAGVADDKVVYAYVPDIIHYYLEEDAILPNVPTWLLRDEKSREHVIANLANLVVKPANESGGYGMLIGPRSTREEREAMAAAIRANPRNYIAQPVLSLSTAPTLVGGEIEPRHLDLRPFILQGERIWVTPGGLTRVALRRGSLVVNSSQGGGSKDTWIVVVDS